MNKLIKWDKIRHEIETAHDIKELTKIKDKLRAYQILAEQSKQSLEVQAKIASYKARADRKCGEWLKENIKHTGGKPSQDVTVTKELGLNRSESSRLQKIADIPEDKFESILQEAEEQTKKITNNMLVKIAKEAKKLNPTDVDIPRIPTKDIVLIKGDVLEVKIPEVDVVFTDPPYNVTGIEWDMIGTDKEYLDFTKKWIKRLKWRSHFFVCCSPKYMADYEMILRELNYPIKSRIIWVHKNMSMGKNVKDKFINCYDMIFHCGKTGLNLPKEWTGERFDVKEFANPQTNFEDMKLHQTQKPKALIEEILRLSTKQGDIVLDCFAGSGSTGLTANELGLKCYLIEKEPKFIKLIEKHLCI